MITVVHYFILFKNNLANNINSTKYCDIAVVTHVEWSTLIYSAKLFARCSILLPILGETLTECLRCSEPLILRTVATVYKTGQFL